MSFNINEHSEVSQIQTVEDSTLGIMKWGQTNSYPQTLINLISQSPSAYPAVQMEAKFLRGQGFDGDDKIVHPTGLTLGELHYALCEDYARFRAFAIHANYNLNNKVSTMIPMRVPTLRFNRFDELNHASKIGYHPNFGLNSVERKLVLKPATKGNIKWFDKFNPKEEIIKKQIANSKDGILANYNGQLLYHSESGMNSYPIPPLQAPINYILSDIENSILVRKETSTGFVNTYLLKTTLGAEDESLYRIEQEIYNSQGARGTGKVITLSDLSPEEVNSTLLEEIGSGGGGSKASIESSILTQELDKKVIVGAYLIPPVLAGININNGFSGVDLEDAYSVFNAITRAGRRTIEKELNRVIASSEFASIGQIKVKPLSIQGEEEILTEEGVVEEEVARVDRNPLSGRQEQSLQRIVRNYHKGKMTREQAEDQLSQDLGFDEKRINTWLGAK